MLSKNIMTYSTKLSNTQGHKDTSLHTYSETYIYRVAKVAEKASKQMQTQLVMKISKLNELNIKLYLAHPVLISSWPTVSASAHLATICMIHI